MCFPCAHLHFLRKLPLFLRKMLPAGVFAVVEEAVAVVDIAVFQHLAEGGGALRTAAHTSLRLRAGQRILPISPVFSGAGLGGRVGAVLPAAAAAVILRGVLALVGIGAVGTAAVVPVIVLASGGQCQHHGQHEKNRRKLLHDEEILLSWLCALRRS